MHPVRPLLLAGLASVAVAGFAGFAHASDPGFKTMTVQLPGGGIEQIEYTGDVAPQVILSPASSVDGDAAPMAVGLPLGATDPFATLEQISAQMDQQAAAMINAVNAMAAGAMAQQPGAMVPAAFGQMPQDSAGYSFIASMTGGTGGACMQSLEITAMGNGQPPRVVSHASGDCGGQPSLGAPSLGVPGGAAPGAVPAALPAAPVPVQQPQLIRVRYLVPKTPAAPSQT